MRLNKWDYTHLDIVEYYAKLSHCTKAKVGAIIVKNERIVSGGYNGLPHNTKCNQCEDENNKTKSDVIHAEMNAIVGAQINGVDLKDTKMFVTHSPCVKCLDMFRDFTPQEIHTIIFKEFLYDEAEYRKEMKRLTEETGIKIYYLGDLEGGYN